MTAAFIFLQPMLFASRFSVAYADTGTGSVSLTTLGSAVTQNFDTLVNTAGSTTNTTLPTGWYITETGGGARDNEQYAVDTGGSNTGDTYSYGATAATDRALGGLRSGTLIPVFGAMLTNNTGSTITSLDISYTGEEWRLGTAARTDRIDFQISTDATDLSTGTYTDVNALDFTTPNTVAPTGAKDGNAAGNRTALSTSITSLSIPNGASFFIRWTDLDATGADDGLSIDDFSVTPQGVAVDIPPTVTSTVPADNATGVALNANVSVTFSEAVTATGSSFQISCASSGTHAFALSGGTTTYTLDPTVDFSNSEVCTVTVFAAQVADQDGTANNMAADYVFDFTTVSATPTLSINDVSLNEGNAGTTAFTFTVSLNLTVHGGVTFDICTADGTAQDDTPATEDNDYTANCLPTQTIPNGSDNYQFTVNVNGDPTVESNETFFVNVTNVTGASVSDGQGQGTINNDDVTITFISQVQGPGASTPIPGASVTVRGIITLLKSNGFFLQEEVADYDSDSATSEGVFVFTSSAPTAALASQVTVTGTVVEFNGLTEISATNANVITNSTGNALPAAVVLTTADLPPTANFTQPQLEKYEGMRLTAPSLTTTAHNDNFFDVPTVITGQPRPLREPGIPADNPVPPDPTTGTPDCCIPIFDLNPEQIVVDTNGRAGSTGETFTSNVVITNLTGPLDYAFGGYRIINEAALVRSPNMSAVAVPAPNSTEFTVAGFNIENFNNNATQRQKASLAIVRVLRLPDIIGHAEITDLADLEALAVEVNTDAQADGHPNPMYEARLIPTPVAGITQNVGFLVKTARVRIDGVTQERTSSTYIRPTDNQSDETHDRPPLVLRATVEPTGANKPVIVVVNHTRSFIDIDLVAGDGLNVRAKRKAQAEDLAGLFQELQTNNPGVPVIAVGDYNALQFNNGYDDPIAVMKGDPTPDDQIVVDASPDLVNPNFFNLIDELPAAERYTFIFDEATTATNDFEETTAQVLDHVLVNTTAHDINTRFAIARMNADFPGVPAAAFASDATRPEGNSDHDAPVAYFTLMTSPTISTQASAGGAVGTQVNDVATLAGGNAATGTVTFRLFSDAACTNQVFTSTNALTGGTTATSDNATPSAPGTYFWTAAYSGDANNNAVTSPCGAPNESVTIASVPDLTITKTHSGSFSSGQVGATYTITVNNIGTVPTDGSTVTVTDNVPAGLTPTGPNGAHNGWTCAINAQTLTCTRSDVLAGGSSYPSITLTVNVANPAPSNVTNTATVSGGGEVNTSNNSASDPTAISCNTDFSLNNTSPLMISRFRMNGPRGPQDEFVEIFNPSTTDHMVASGNCGGGGYGVFSSSGNGTTSNAAPLVCFIPNGTVIPAGGYYLCTGATYSLSNLGRNGGAEGATSVGDAPIGCGGSCTGDIRDDAGLALMNVAQGINLTPDGGFLGGVPDAGFILYDKVGFGPYGGGAPAPGYPSLAGNFCEGAACLKPVGDASTGGACTNPSGLFPVVSAPPACYGLAGQYEFLRRQTTFDPDLGTLHQDSNNSANDWILVAPNSGINMGLGVTGVLGVTAVHGAAAPQGSIAPADTPSTSLTQGPFDSGAPQLGARNAERNYGLDPTIVDPANNPDGTFALRLRFTNNSGSDIAGLRFRVDQISTLCGPQTGTPAVGTGAARNLSSSPDCGAGSFTAILKLLNSAQEVVIDSTDTAYAVNGTVIEDLSAGTVMADLKASPALAAESAGPLSPKGGGLDNSFIVNPSSDAASVGDGVTGGTGEFSTAIGTTDDDKVLYIKVKFGVVRSGRFILLITPAAKTGR